MKARGFKKEYGIYEEGDLIDVLSFSKKELTAYKKENPTYEIELLEDEIIEDDNVDGEYD